jgi:hypothetical protein
LGGRNVKLFHTWNFYNIKTWNNNTLWQWTLNLITNFVNNLGCVLYSTRENWCDIFCNVQENWHTLKWILQKKNVIRHKQGRWQESRSQILFAMCITMHQQFTPFHVASQKKHIHTLISFWWCLSSHFCSL